eukprot:m.327700 g.327700  ORF g.327700 m.327700 type:complete len:70 (+) comp20420_c0_seq9:195-404(+)
MVSSLRAIGSQGGSTDKHWKSLFTTEDTSMQEYPSVQKNTWVKGSAKKHLPQCDTRSQDVFVQKPSPTS